MKLDVLGNHIPSILHSLKELTGIEPTSISLDDEETLNMICSADTTGIPEFETERARNIILETHSSNFYDLIKILGLLHGTDVWENNAQDLIKNGTATLKEVIACRDDIMNYLTSVGIANETAFRIMGFVCRGKSSKEKWATEWKEFAEIMQEHNVPDWYIKSCKKIKYMFPKAHEVGYVINSYRIAWYKVHYKKEFDEVIKNRNINDVKE